jgi:hypothetical protein
MTLDDVQIGAEWAGLVARTVGLYTRRKSETLKGRYNLGDLGVYCRIILKYVFED